MEKTIIKRIFLISAIIASFYLGASGIVEAATLSFSPQANSYSLGQTFAVSVVVGSPSQSINAVSGSVSFPSDKLEILSLDKTGSIVNLWVEEPKFSNTSGSVTFEGVVLNPGYIGSAGKVVTIRFRPKVAGTAQVRFTSGEVLLNDGSGTNATESIGTAEYRIESALPIKEVPAIKDEIKPHLLEISLVNRDDPTNPLVGIEIKASDEESGIDHYEIFVDDSYKEVWKDLGKHIYTTPVLKPGNHLILVKVFDKASNYIADSLEVLVESIPEPLIRYYNAEIGVNEPIIIQGENCPKLGKVSVSLREESEEYIETSVLCDEHGAFTFVSKNNLNKGIYTAKIKSVDSRGAESEYTEEISIAVSESKIVSTGRDIFEIMVIVISLAGSIVIFGGMTLFVWRSIVRLKKKVYKETKEAEEVLHKTFGLLHKDVADAVNLLEGAKKNRELTKEEKIILRDLEADLDEAEKYIGKEIRDIEKEVRKGA